MKLAKQEKRVVEDLVLTIIGFILLMLVPRYVDPNFGFLLLMVGSALATVSLIDVWRAMHNKPFIDFKRFQKNKRSLRKNSKGVVWIWAAAIATLIMSSIVYFIASYPLDLIIQLVTEGNGFTFTGVMGGAFDLCRQIVAWLLGFCVFGVVMWVLVNANKRGADYPALG